LNLLDLHCSFLYSGHPKPYCDYIFKAIDKNRSGTINFVEFTDAVALTQSNNADIRLKRVCSSEKKKEQILLFNLPRFSQFAIRIIREQ
jgi:Ca2+-binding EF-hand superfamily protein